MSLSLPQDAQGWQALAELVESEVFQNPSLTLQLTMWIIAALLLSTATLYLASCALVLCRDPARRWIIRKDSDGYWSPNIHVTIPIMIVIYATMAFVAIARLQLESSGMVRPVTFGLVLGSFTLLYLVGWTDTWATMYAIPPSPFLFNASQAGITTRTASRPWLFNAFTASGYLLMIPSIPLAVYLCVTLARLNKDYSAFLLGIKKIIAAYGRNDLRSVQELTFPTVKSALDLTGSSDKLFLALRLSSGWFAIASVYNWATFIFASWRILSGLTRQLFLYRSILQRHRDFCRLQRQNNLLTHSFSDLMRPRAKSGSLSVDYDSGSSIDIRGWKRFFPSWSVGAVDQTLWSTLDVAGPAEARERDGLTTREIGETKQHYRRLRLYTVNTGWRVAISSMMQLAFISLQITVSSNALDVPNTHSFRQMSIILCQWFGWTFGAPCCILGIIAVIVAATARPTPRASEIPLPDSDSELDEPHHLHSGRRSISLQHLRSPSLTPGYSPDLSGPPSAVLRGEKSPRDTIRLSGKGEKWGMAEMKGEGDVAVLRALRVASSDGERGDTEESGEVDRPF